MTAAEINSKVDAAIAAQEAGDFALAMSYLRSAWMALAAIPDVSGRDGLQWGREQVGAMMAELRRAQTASRSKGLQRTKINYVQPDCD